MTNKPSSLILRRSQLFLGIVLLLLIGCNNKTAPKETPVPQFTQMHQLQITPTATLQQKQSFDGATWSTTIFYTDGESPHAYPYDYFSKYDELDGIFAFIFQQEIERYEYLFTLISPSPSCNKIVLQEVNGYNREHQAQGATWLVDRTSHELIKIVDEPVLVKWSPDGTRLLYERKSGLYLQVADELGQSVQVEQNNLDRAIWFGWSPDSRWIAYVKPLQRGDQLWLMSAQNYSKRLLDTLTLPASGYNPEVDPVQWNPASDTVRIVTESGQAFYNLDGDRLSLEVFENDEWIFCKAEKCISQPGMIGPMGYTMMSPAWAICPRKGDIYSPLGFSHDCSKRGVVIDKALYVNDLQTGDMKKLVKLDHGLVGRIYWSPDDDFTFFSELPDFSSHQFGRIYFFNVRTENLGELPVRGLLGVCFQQDGMD